MANGFRLGPKAWEKAGRSPMGAMSSSERGVQPSVSLAASSNERPSRKVLCPRICFGRLLAGTFRPQALSLVVLLIGILSGAG
jgi:hypothetical protein